VRKILAKSVQQFIRLVQRTMEQVILVSTSIIVLVIDVILHCVSQDVTHFVQFFCERFDYSFMAPYALLWDGSNAVR